MPTPLVSVIMPVYNTEKYVSESIRSILGQTYQNIELICVNDGSTDGSLDILKSFGDAIVIIDLLKNSGIGAARNAGIRIARGTFVAFADADDIWNPRKLEEQMEQFQNDPLLDISFCMIENFLSPDVSPEVKASRSFPTGPIAGQISGTFVVRASSFGRIGLLNETYRVGEFIDWMARAQEARLRSEMIGRVLYLRRVHETNTAGNRPAQADYLRIMKAALDRKRVQ